MTVSYKTTFYDVIAFSFYNSLTSPLLLSVLVAGFAFISYEIFQSAPNFLIFLAHDMIAFCVLAVWMAVATVVTMISRRNKTFLTEHTITLNDDCFTEESLYGRAEMKWIIVQKLVRTKNYIFIYVTRNSAHVVPRRAFRDNQEWTSFFEFCRQRNKV